MKLFQIEEPDGSPVDPDAPGVAIGIDLTGAQAEVAMSVGGNAVVLPDREDFPLDLPVPTAAAAAAEWRDLFEGARLRAERALASPVTHAALILTALPDPLLSARLHEAAAQAGLCLLHVGAASASRLDERAALTAAKTAEDLAPRPDTPRPEAP